MKISQSHTSASLLSFSFFLAVAAGRRLFRSHHFFLISARLVETASRCTNQPAGHCERHAIDGSLIDPTDLHARFVGFCPEAVELYFASSAVNQQTLLLSRPSAGRAAEGGSVIRAAKTEFHVGARRHLLTRKRACEMWKFLVAHPDCINGRLAAARVRAACARLRGSEIGETAVRPTHRVSFGGGPCVLSAV
jgi:hypothetical protein